MLDLSIWGLGDATIFGNVAVLAVTELNLELLLYLTVT